MLATSFFPSAAVLERVSSESWWISTLFLACEIDGGAWNGFLRFSRKRTDLSKKKLHSVCILTKVYQSAKEERFWFFEPCHESAILVDFCMDSLLNTMKSFLAFKVISTWIFVYFQKGFNMKLWQNTQFTTAISFCLSSPPSAVNITS